MSLSLGSKFLTSGVKRAVSPSNSFQKVLVNRHAKSRTSFSGALNRQQMRTVYCINKITLMGHAGGDPQVHTFHDGTSMTTFSLAVSENYVSRKTGERVDKTDWFRISIQHERMQENVMKMVQKGSRVYVEGTCRPRKWTDSAGVERTTVEVIVRSKGEVVVLSKAADGSDGSHGSHGQGGSDNHDSL